MSATSLLVGRELEPVAAPSTRQGIWSVYRAERRKLSTQLAIRLLAIVCVLGPFAFAAILAAQSSTPSDTLFGVWSHTTGFATSLVVLGFGASWGFAVVAGVVAGDIFSSEDRYGTWKTVLTRSCDRRQVFVGKLLAAATFTVAMGALMAIASVVAGVVLVGSHPLVGLGGNLLSPGHAVLLVLVSWLVSLLPALGFMSLAVLLSIATRNGIIGVMGPSVIGLVMQLLLLIGNGELVHSLLLGEAFNGWHGLFAAHPFYGQLAIACVVSVVWIAACLGASWLILRRRDFAGVPAVRRVAWIVPVRAVLIGVGVIALLALGGGLGSVGITPARVMASITPTFSNLTVLQQRELGRYVPAGAKLRVLTSCSRRSGSHGGPGDDWSCTLDVFIPQPGAVPFQSTPVTYDMSIQSDGCYKAESPPSFVGQALMKAAGGKNVVNPLFTIYGCFNPQ